MGRICKEKRDKINILDHLDIHKRMLVAMSYNHEAAVLCLAVRTKTTLRREVKRSERESPLNLSK